jgi:hypothetical protein
MFGFYSYRMTLYAPQVLHKAFELGTMVCYDPGTFITCGERRRGIGPKNSSVSSLIGSASRTKPWFKKRITSIQDGSEFVDYRSNI